MGVTIPLSSIGAAGVVVETDESKVPKTSDLTTFGIREGGTAGVRVMLLAGGRGEGSSAVRREPPVEPVAGLGRTPLCTGAGAGAEDDERAEKSAEIVVVVLILPAVVVVVEVVGIRLLMPFAVDVRLREGGRGRGVGGAAPEGNML